jgi:endonuclease/exonuclease/phosphatase family metal-dependent hydrolase
MARHRSIVVRALTWNLFHGRDFPPNPALLTWRSRLLRITERDATHAQVNRSLRGEFASRLAGWPWDLALLQEAPPRWRGALAERAEACSAMALTSRNSLPRLRAAIADRNPDLIASNEGGSNQLLVRPPLRLTESRRLQLSVRPEKRVMLWAQVETGAGPLAVANLHATAGDPSFAARDVELAAERALEWADGAPLLLGGDYNLRPGRQPEVFERLRERYGLAPATAPGAIDHLLVRGLSVLEEPTALGPEEREVPGPGGLRIRLSDHAPIAAAFEMR